LISTSTAAIGPVGEQRQGQRHVGFLAPDKNGQRRKPADQNPRSADAPASRLAPIRAKPAGLEAAAWLVADGKTNTAPAKRAVSAWRRGRITRRPAQHKTQQGTTARQAVAACRGASAVISPAICAAASANQAQARSAPAAAGCGAGRPRHDGQALFLCSARRNADPNSSMTAAK